MRREILVLDGQIATLLCLARYLMILEVRHNLWTREEHNGKKSWIQKKHKENVTKMHEFRPFYSSAVYYSLHCWFVGGLFGWYIFGSQAAFFGAKTRNQKALSSLLEMNFLFVLLHPKYFRLSLWIMKKYSSFQLDRGRQFSQRFRPPPILDKNDNAAAQRPIWKLPDACAKTEMQFS